MTTRELMNKLPENVKRNLEGLRHDYKSGVVNRDIARAQSAWYVKGLRDAGLVTDRERSILFCYTTV